jgi:hypothetical protein
MISRDTFLTGSVLRRNCVITVADHRTGRLTSGWPPPLLGPVNCELIATSGTFDLVVWEVEGGVVARVSQSRNEVIHDGRPISPCGRCNSRKMSDSYELIEDSKNEGAKWCAPTEYSRKTARAIACLSNPKTAYAALAMFTIGSGMRTRLDCPVFLSVASTRTTLFAIRIGSLIKSNTSPYSFIWLPLVKPNRFNLKERFACFFSHWNVPASAVPPKGSPKER